MNLEKNLSIKKIFLLVIIVYLLVSAYNGKETFDIEIDFYFY